MPRIVFDDSFCPVTARYLVQKPDGTFFYQRKVPIELKSRYDGKSLIRGSLQTKDAVKAAQRAKKYAEQDSALRPNWRKTGSKPLTEGKR